MRLSDELAMKLILWARSQPNVRRLIVFGSFAKGTAAPDSDLDVAVELDGDEGEALADFIFEEVAWKRQLSKLLGCEFDLHLGGEAAGPVVRQGLVEAAISVYTRRSKPDA